jgi:hypothetical protein
MSTAVRLKSEKYNAFIMALQSYVFAIWQRLGMPRDTGKLYPLSKFSKKEELARFAFAVDEDGDHFVFLLYRDGPGDGLTSSLVFTFRFYPKKTLPTYVAMDTSFQTSRLRDNCHCCGNRRALYPIIEKMWHKPSMSMEMVCNNCRDELLDMDKICEHFRS